MAQGEHQASARQKKCLVLADRSQLEQVVMNLSLTPGCHAQGAP
jgi:C4-dicarboxylate-specific signal transduction histidine kinase